MFGKTFLARKGKKREADHINNEGESKLMSADAIIM